MGAMHRSLISKVTITVHWDVTRNKKLEWSAANYGSRPQFKHREKHC